MRRVLLLAMLLPVLALGVPKGSIYTGSHSSPRSSSHSTSSACPGYEVDHRTPLACGGSDSPGNMQWLTKSANRSKGAAGCKRK